MSGLILPPKPIPAPPDRIGLTHAYQSPVSFGVPVDTIGAYLVVKIAERENVVMRRSHSGTVESFFLVVDLGWCSEDAAP